MEHDLELIIPRLEILEIEVCNIIYKPRDIGNLSFSTSSYPGNIGSYDPYSVLSWKYWKLKSSTFSIILEILEIGFFQFSHILEILDIGFFQFSGILEMRAAAGGRLLWSGFPSWDYFWNMFP